MKESKEPIDLDLDMDFLRRLSENRGGGLRAAVFRAKGSKERTRRPGDRTHGRASKFPS